MNEGVTIVAIMGMFFLLLFLGTAMERHDKNKVCESLYKNLADPAFADIKLEVVDAIKRAKCYDR